MLDQLKLEDFEPHVGTEFKVAAGEDVDVTAKLVEATASPYPGHEKGTRDPFSFVLLVPPGPHLPQQIYTVTHPEHGELEIFLVPVGEDHEGTRYEAVFT